MPNAYGSITIVDISDLGQLSVIPESNHPTSVVFDPNLQKYNPKWKFDDKNKDGKPLVLTPVIYYGGTQKQKTDPGISIEWESKDSEGNLNKSYTTGPNGELTIATNPFEPAGENGTPINFITYFVTVKYNVPGMENTTLVAKGQISFNLVISGTNGMNGVSPAALKGLKISGETAFLYDSSNTLINKTIILTASKQNGAVINGWFYKDSKGVFQRITGQKGDRLEIIRKDHPDWFNGKRGVFRVQQDSSVYDEHTIVEIHDGTNGTSTYTAILDNEEEVIPCDENGVPIGLDTQKPTSTIKIYEGSKDVTSEWTVKAIPHGVTVSTPETSKTQIVTGIDADIGYIAFECRGPSGTSPIVKKFTLTKVRKGMNGNDGNPGKDGTSPIVYSIQSNCLAVNRILDLSNSLIDYSPKTFSIKCVKRVGNTIDPNYKAFFHIKKENGTRFSINTAAKSSVTVDLDITKPIGNFLIIELYNDNPLQNPGDPLSGLKEGIHPVDTQTIVVTENGKRGQEGQGGPPGKDSYSFTLGNYSDVVSCSYNGEILGEQKFVIPVTVYKGTTKVNNYTMQHTDSKETLKKVGISNIEYSTGPQPTATVTFSQPTTNFENVDGGTITFEITANGFSSRQDYSWKKNKKALDGQNGQDGKNGQNAILFDIFAPNGNIISNKKNDVQLQARLLDGIEEVIPTSYVWSKYFNGSYTPIEGQTSKILTVDKDSVNGYASFQCECKYKEKPYIAYFSVYDKQDPIQVNVYSTLGDKIVNSQGTGILYAEVSRNGSVLDQIKTIKTTTTIPGAGASGYIWYLDTTKKTVHLYNGSQEVSKTDRESKAANYSWSALQGTLPQGLDLNSQVIYLDSQIINKKVIFNVEATLK